MISTVPDWLPAHIQLVFIPVILRHEETIQSFSV